MEIENVLHSEENSIILQENNEAETKARRSASQSQPCIRLLHL
jgi:hypothetical protein